MASTVEYSVRLADLLREKSDLLLLKHAQGFYGADEQVAAQLVARGICQREDLFLEPGKYALLDTGGVIAPARVMFLGTPPLASFEYDEMQSFARRFIQILDDLSLPVRVVTTTVHGTGYGLDGGEALQRLVQGFEEGMAQTRTLKLEQIIFLTLGERAERTLARAVAALRPAPQRPEPSHAVSQVANNALDQQFRDSRPSALQQAPPAASDLQPDKKRVFVAMPFSEDFQNVYEFGIYPGVRDAGFICEKVDEVHFTGDILERIRNGIETADVVIADLTDERPNVYLEVGYAWGRRKPVIILARKGQKLHFDVNSHRCIYYGRFTTLASELTALLRGLEASGEI